MSLHAIEIAAAVAVAIIFCRLRSILCCYVEPLATSVTRCKMKVKPAFQLFWIVALNPSENVKLLGIARL